MSATYAPARLSERADAGAGTMPRRGLLAAAALFGGATLCALLLIVPGTIDHVDGRSMYLVTRSIVERGDVAVQGSPFGVPGLHGQLYSKYGPGQSVLAVPLYLAGRTLAGLVPPYYRPELPLAAASLLPALATALTAALIVLAAVELGASRRGALALAAVYVVATLAPVYAAQWFSEPLTGVGVLAAFYLLVRDRAAPTLWRPLLAGVALAVSVATRLDCVVLAAPLCFYAMLGNSRGAMPEGGSNGPLLGSGSSDFKGPMSEGGSGHTLLGGSGLLRVALVFAPVGAALIAVGAYDLARFGSPFETGYDKGDIFAYRDTHPEHSLASFAAGLYGLMLSPGKGLLEYAPPLLLAPLGAVALWGRRRAETVLLLTLFSLYTAEHANILIRWLGGWSWGPRFVVPVVPLALLLLAPLLHPARRHARIVAAALAALAVAGALVQAPALAIRQPYTYINTLVHTTFPGRPIGQIEDAYTNQIDLSPIIGSWHTLGTAAWWAPPIPAPSPSAAAAESLTFTPHTWWAMLSLQGVAASGLWLACALLALAAVVLFGAAFRIAGGVDVATGSA